MYQENIRMKRELDSEHAVGKMVASGLQFNESQVTHLKSPTHAIKAEM